MPTTMSLWMFVIKYGTTMWIPLINLVFRRKKVPEVTDPLLKIPAVDLAEMIRTKRVTSVKVVQAYIDRIKEVNPILNAVVEDCFTAALDEAKKADELCNTLTEEQLKERYPLLGVPFTVKEAVGVKGMAFDIGDVSRSKVKANDDGVSIKFLRAAGAIPVAVTSVPEWCLAIETHNKIIGRTVNPYNTKHSSGGSSGGEAALISAGASVFGMGTDFMGSIRLPAMFTGIFGHRPTRPLISNEGSEPYIPDEIFQRTFCVGPLCRYAKDLPILMKITAGPNVSLMNLDEPVDLSKLKVYYPTKYCKGWDAVKVKTEINECIIRSAFSLKGAGAEIITIDMFEENMIRQFLCKYLEMDFTEFYKMSGSIPFKFWGLPREYLKWLVGASDHTLNAIFAHHTVRYNKLSVTHKDQVKYQTQANEFGNKLKKLLDNNSVLLLPTFPTAAFKHYGSFDHAQGTSYLMVSSIFNLPATAVPIDLNKKRLPIGIQVVANEYQDRLCLAVAQHLEKEFGGWVPPTND